MDTAVEQEVKCFSMLGSLSRELTTFTEHTAPDWLTSKNTLKGSTMDGRWFWTDHVLTLEIGKSIKTDFSKITRIK